ncbi:hypothetical protein SKAU_G00343930 [Synaphobranchus kaupii]|uniref:Uncharacterized protein n=1 Tax=Synaphobranchus kaupii TaxID=118154 RepID=A0A9Q1EJ91_SYNKA|nr:hypothetical protein SKAU_G00343930 [Synaphobranchus kaupii]
MTEPHRVLFVTNRRWRRPPPGEPATGNASSLGGASRRFHTFARTPPDRRLRTYGWMRAGRDPTALFPQLETDVHRLRGDPANGGLITPSLRDKQPAPRSDTEPSPLCTSRCHPAPSFIGPPI